MHGFGTYNNNLARIQNLENAELKITYYTEINNTSGTITKPEGSTILLNQLAGGADALLTTINSGPTGEAVQTSGLAIVDVATFNSSGDYTLTGTPSSYPVALIYWISVPLSSMGNVDLDFVLEQNWLYGADIESGLYSPIGTIVTNLDNLTLSDGHYLRIGNECYVRIAAILDPTSTGSTSFRISLPFLSSFTTASDAHGLASGIATSTGRTLQASADSVNNEITLTGSLNHTTSVNYDISFIYTIK